MKKLLRFIVPVEIWLVAVLSSAAMIGIYDWLHPTSIARDSMIQNARESSVKVEKSRGHGSGVVIASGGRIITNAHVCNKAENISVRLWNDVIVPAEIIWNATIEKYDLCLIDAKDWYYHDKDVNEKLAERELKYEELSENLKKIKIRWNVAEFADHEPKIGSPVMHIGNMMMVRELISFGTIGRMTRGWNKEKAFAYVGTAGPGSSGGGVFNLDGELLGLIYSASAIRIGPLGIPVGVSQILPYYIIQYALTK